MREFWYDCIKPKHKEKRKTVLYCENCDSFIISLQTDYIYKDIADFIAQIMNQKERCQKEEKKNHCHNKIRIRWQNLERICRIKSKSKQLFSNDNKENKKVRETKINLL